MKKPKDSLGVSMMEMVLYIGISTVIAAGVFRLYAEAVEKTRRVEIQNRIPELAKQVNLLWAGRDMGNDANTYLRSKKIRLSHPWSPKDTDADPAISVSSKGSASGTTPLARTHIEIQVKYLPKAACAWMASTMLDVGFCITGTSKGTPADTDCNPTPAVAVDQCNKADATNIVYIRARKE
ncbi:MAG: hypothetical protein LBI17_00935 [Rickettsiales bacterium]|jgi:hypothetical protein|nr:hypothetical protein [Rickettsiales bacterium]